MDVPTFFKERERMCEYYKNGIDCCGCPIAKKDLIRYENCLDYCTHYPEKAVEIVESWAKEHPVKTYKSLFLEKFPDAPLSMIGDPIACIKDIFAEAHEMEGCEGHKFCQKCWNLKMKVIEVEG